jgi:hypothetical protein
MSSVQEAYHYYLKTVGEYTKNPDLLPLLAYQTSSCNDPKTDLEYLWQCMTGQVSDLQPIDAQRVCVMQWVGYIFQKMQNHTTAQWFPNVFKDGPTTEDIANFCQQVEALRVLCTEEQLKQVPPPPKLTRTVCHAVSPNLQPLPKPQLWRNGERPP